MALNVPGLVVMAIFYLVILGTGIWASMRSKKAEKKCRGDGMEITLLAGRNINMLVGIFTLTGESAAGGLILDPILAWNSLNGGIILRFRKKKKKDQISRGWSSFQRWFSGKQEEACTLLFSRL